MEKYFIRALLKALRPITYLLLAYLATGWPSLYIIPVVFVGIVAYQWLVIEVDLSNIKNIKNSKVSVAVVGSGFSGICAGIKLKSAGIPFKILEKSEDIGGTWWDNKYPGCAVDSEEYRYSFFHDLNRSTNLPDRKEIHE